MEVKNKDGIEFLNDDVEDNSVDLILTDPPYIISKDTGMNKHYNNVKKNEKDNIKYVKTEADWIEYKKTLKNLKMNSTQIVEKRRSCLVQRKLFKIWEHIR